MEAINQIKTCIGRLSALNLEMEKQIKANDAVLGILEGVAVSPGTPAVSPGYSARLLEAIQEQHETVKCKQRVLWVEIRSAVRVGHLHIFETKMQEWHKLIEAV